MSLTRGADGHLYDDHGFPAQVVANEDGTSVSVARVNGAAVSVSNPVPVEDNVLNYAEDSVTAHGRALTPFTVIVTADDQQLIAAPGSTLLIRLYRLNVQLRSGGAACEAGASFTAAGASIHDSVLTAAGQPGGFNAAPNYLQGGLNEGLFAVLSTGSSVRYTGLYELVDPSTEVVP